MHQKRGYLVWPKLVALRSCRKRDTSDESCAAQAARKVPRAKFVHFIPPADTDILMRQDIRKFGNGNFVAAMLGVGFIAKTAVYLWIPRIFFTGYCWSIAPVIGAFNLNSYHHHQHSLFKWKKLSACCWGDRTFGILERQYCRYAYYQAVIKIYSTVIWQ